MGTGVLTFWYVVSMIVFAAPADTTSDDAAAVGLIILGVPTLVVVTSLLVLGGAVGEALRLLHHHFGWSSRSTETIRDSGVRFGR
jgi:hypothetical protein